MDLEKYRRLFLVEATENLRLLTQSLSALEQNSSVPSASGVGSEDAIHELFRAAHSMKGMAAAVGYPHFAEVAHGLEDLADVHRQGEELTATDVALLWSGSDLLAQLLEHLQDEQAHDPKMSADWLAQTRSRLARPAVASTQELSISAGQPQIPELSASDGNISPHEGEMALQVWLEPGISMPKARAFLVYRQVSQCAQFLRADPSPETWSEAHEKRGFLWYTFATNGLATAAVTAAVESLTGVERLQWHEPTPNFYLPASTGTPELSESIPPEVPVAPTNPRPEAKVWERSVRVRAGLLDGFMDSVSELLLMRAKLRAVALRSNENELSDLVDEVERQVRDLHARVVAVRMTPLHFMTDSIPRSVRDIARRTNKEVQVHIEGASIEVDRAILDELHTPMIHLLRNAVDHGHEGSDRRVEAGKSPQMTIHVKARRENEHLLLSFEDDGAGIDVERVTQRAIEKGLVKPAQLVGLDTSQILDFICAPGFSTKNEVTDISGRGVGMDVVKQGVERLGGKMSLESSVGEGTQVHIRVPLTVSLMQVLLVEAEGSPRAASQPTASEHENFAGLNDASYRRASSDAVPIFAVAAQRVLRVVSLPDHIPADSVASKSLSVDGRNIPLYDLAETLGYPALRKGAAIALIVENGAEPIAFRAARIVGQEEVVAKPLGFPLSRIPYVAGATLLADGRAAFILEPSRLPVNRATNAALP